MSLQAKEEVINLREKNASFHIYLQNLTFSVSYAHNQLGFERLLSMHETNNEMKLLVLVIKITAAKYDTQTVCGIKINIWTLTCKTFKQMYFLIMYKVNIYIKNSFVTV